MIINENIKSFIEDNKCIECNSELILDYDLMVCSHKFNSYRHFVLCYKDNTLNVLTRNFIYNDATQAIQYNNGICYFVDRTNFGHKSLKVDIDPKIWTDIMLMKDKENYIKKLSKIMSLL